jgi:hypothetical protein
MVIAMQQYIIQKQEIAWIRAAAERPAPVVAPMKTKR